MGIQLTNVSLETQFMEGDEGGMAEPLYVTALPRNMQTKARPLVWHAAAGACMTLNGLSAMLCLKQGLVAGHQGASRAFTKPRQRVRWAP